MPWNIFVAIGWVSYAWLDVNDKSERNFSWHFFTLGKGALMHASSQVDLRAGKDFFIAGTDNPHIQSPIILTFIFLHTIAISCPTPQQYNSYPIYFNKLIFSDKEFEKKEHSFRWPFKQNQHVRKYVSTNAFISFLQQTTASSMESQIHILKN